MWHNWCTTTGSERFSVVLCPSFKCPLWEGHLTDHPQPPVSYFFGSLSAASTDWVCSSFWAVMVACSAVMARVWLAFCQLFFLFTSTPCLDVSQILGRFLYCFLCWFKCTVLFLIVCESILLQFNFGCFLVPTNDGISGVLLVQAKNNVYSFNATTAREACEAIKMRIANLAEVKTANQNGLQTCR